MRRKFLMAALIMTLSVAFLSGAAPAQAAISRNCQEVQIPASLATGLPKTEYLAGQLCLPATGGEIQAVDVLVPGASYDRNYWDFGYNDAQYSYVNKTLSVERATLALDRIGTGRSSRPLSAAITATSSAHTIHDAVQWLRHTKNFNQVHLIGHSLGSAISLEEAATYHDIDALVLTGFSSMPNIGNMLPGVLGLHPALIDPILKDKGYLDPGYVTTAPSTRPDLFYTAQTDPAVIAYDEARKAALSATELSTAIAGVEVPALLNISQRITAPTFMIIGNQDKVFCGGAIDCTSVDKFTAYHRSYFTHAATLNAAIIPATGHALTTAPTAQQSFETINNWLMQ
jgi:pimeloyl-ACP methyl ester carboxylesterase